MKVLVLTQYFWPETFRITETVESLRQAGCEVTVLTGQPNYPDGKVFPGYRAWQPRREIHPAGYPVLRVPMAPRGSGTALRLAANYLSFVVSASTVGLWLLRRQRFDVIFVYAISPILQAVPGILFRRLRHAALVTWVQDLWPQSLEVTGFIRDRRLLALTAVIVRWIYRHCDLLLVQSPGFLPIVRRMSGKTPVEYHPNPGELAFEATPAGSAALMLEPGFNVVFAGNLGSVQALDTLLAAAQLLRGLPSVRFVLIGSGSRASWAQREVQRLGLTNVHMPGRFAAEQMPAILAQASALLVSLARDPIMSQTVPSKMQAYLAAGRPIIAALDGEGARVVEQAGAGITCPAEDAAALAQAVRTLHATSAQALERMGQSGRRYYEQHFEPGVLARRLAQRFADLVTTRQRVRASRTAEEMDA